MSCCLLLVVSCGRLAPRGEACNYLEATMPIQIEAAETAYRICANEVRMACAGNLEIVKEVMNENKTAGRA